MKDNRLSPPRHLAFFSPLPPERTGIADYCRELLPYLVKLISVSIFTEYPEQVPAELRTLAKVHPIERFGSEIWRYDIAVYHMGNSMYHDALYRVLLRHPGITVLHDLGLHHFMAARSVGQGDFAGYARELGYALGTNGVDLAYQIQQGRAEPPFSAVPLNERVLDHSLGVIVHSHYAARWIRDTRPNLPVVTVPAPICADLGPLRSRYELGCSEETLLFASAGQVFPQKQVTFALEAFARLRLDFPRARYAVVGDALEQEELDLRAWLQQHDLEDAVILTGHLDDLRDFTSWVAAADVLVNLRFPTAGETSATALRGMAAGRPVIVSDHGWYAELPDDACVKVAPNDSEALYQAMRRLAENPALRHGIGQRAAAYVQRDHSLATAAQRYRDFIDQIVGRVTDRLAKPESRHGEPQGGREN